MEEMRKETIIQEIIYWKTNKMLPVRYCDYLLALYSEGEGIPEVKKSLKDKYNVYFYLFLGIIITCNLVLNYSTEFPFAMQMTAAVISVITIGTSCFIAKNRNHMQFGLIVGALLVLLITVQAVDNLHLGNEMLFALLLINCGLWIFIGKKVSLSYFWIAGIAGICLMGYFIAKLYNIF